MRVSEPSRRSLKRWQQAALAAALGLLAALAAAGPSVKDLPVGPDGMRDPQQLKEFFDNFKGSQSEYFQEWDYVSKAEEIAVRELWTAEIEADQKQRSNDYKAEAAAGSEWLQNTSNVLVTAYQELPPGAAATGVTTAGEGIVRGSEYYVTEINRLEGVFNGYLTDLRATEARVNTITANLVSHQASTPFWAVIDDEREDFLEAELAKASGRLPFLRAMTVASGEALQNTIQTASQYQSAQTIAGIKNDPKLLAADYQRRVNELVALQQELAVSRLQFVAGQAEFEKVIADLDAKIAKAEADGERFLPDGYRGAKTKVEDTYKLWRAGVETSLANKGKAVVDAFAQNASAGIGPTDANQLVQHLASCGTDPGMVLAGRDPKTGEFVVPDAEGRIASAAASAETTALGVRFGRSLQYDWGDWAYDASGTLFSTETITSAPYNAWRYTKGVGKAAGNAAYDLGVFVVEGGDLILETDQWYYNAFVGNTPGLNQLGIEIDWFGQENIQTGGQFINWLSTDYSGNVYNATQSGFAWAERRREMQAGSGDVGQAVEDVGFVTGTVATIFVGPEELLIRAAARATGAGGRVAGATVAAAENVSDAATTGARVAEAVTPPGQPVGTGAGRVADEFTEAVTPRGPASAATPGPGSGAASASNAGSVDVLQFPGGVTILTHSSGARLPLNTPIGTGGGTQVFAHPTYPKLAVKLTDKTGSDLNKLGAAALEGADPNVVRAPRVHQTMDVSTPDLPGHTVQIVDRIPKRIFDDAAQAIAANGGDLTTGQQEALGLFLDDLASRAWGVADLKADNFTFMRTGPGDSWVVVPIDPNMYIPFKTAADARAFHDALLNPPARFLDGPWTNPNLLAQGRLDNLNGFRTYLASGFDGRVDWARVAALTGVDNYSTLAPTNLTGFPFNPRLAQQFPALRAGDALLDAMPPPASATTGNVPVQTSELPGRVPMRLPFRSARAEPPPGSPYGSPTGYPPRFLLELGVKSPLPGFLGAPPVQACIPSPLPAAGTAATGQGMILHVPVNWLRNANLFPDSPTTISMLPITTSRFLIGQCNNGDCTGATAVIVLNYNVADAAAVNRAVQSYGVLWSGNDALRGKQAIPDDPYFSSRGSWGQSEDDQWGLKKIGLDAGPPAIADGKAPGGEPVIVAVIDSGVAWNHRDISIDQLWINTDEIPYNRVDDDGNGYIDDVAGWNFVNQNNLPWDLDGHGTLVAGIIAAGTNNGRGTAGVNPRARIMALKALDEVGKGRASWLAEAITYAVDNGARVINLSVGGRQRTPTEQLALDYARQRGVLVVAAAGNEGIELDDYAPAGAEHVLTVAASDPADRRLSSSNRGPAVDLTAPGKDILGPRAIRTDLMANTGNPAYRPGTNIVGRDRAYYRASGTSFAAPLVSGVASLLLSASPALSAEQLERVLVQSAVDIETPGLDQVSGYGRLDARAALAASPDFYVEARIADVRVAEEGGRKMVQVLGTADANQFAGARLELGAGRQPQTWQPARAPVQGAVRGGQLLSIDPAELAASREWTLRLVVEHANGRSREARFLLDLN